MASYDEQHERTFNMGTVFFIAVLLATFGYVAHSYAESQSFADVIKHRNILLPLTICGIAGAFLSANTASLFRGFINSSNKNK